MSDLVVRRRVAEEAVRAAAAVHLAHRRQGIETQTKGGNTRDLVTAADIEAEAVARTLIERAFPGEEVIGEEDGSSKERIAEVLGDRGWLIDPLDGTFNFVHGFPDFSATVAYVENGEPVVGATYAPLLNECFVAAKGLGATLNDEPIHVSSRSKLSEAIVNVFLGPPENGAVLIKYARVRQATFSQRTFGGTALVLAYLAAGRFDLFHTSPNTRMGPWDIAAGVVLVQEAGGAVTLNDGSPFRLPADNLTAATSEAMLAELRRILA